MASTKRTHRPSFSWRALGWVHGGLNPLIDALDQEIVALEEGTIGYDPRRRRFDWVRPTSELLLPDARLHIIDLARNAKAFARAGARHDEAVEGLREEAQALYEDLVSDAELQATLDQLKRQFVQSHGRDPWSNWNTQDHAAHATYVAERLVNRVRSLGATHGDAEFWSFAGPELLRAASRRGGWANFDDFLRAVLSAARNYRETADEVRSDLCGKYDIPIAPIPGLSLPLTPQGR